MQPAPLCDVVRTTDRAYIEGILRHPDCAARLSDDYTEVINPPISDATIWLRPVEGGGVVMFHAHNFTLWFVHAAILKTHRKSSVIFAKSCAAWMRKNTPCRAILALIAQGNYPAMRLVEAVGFVRTGNIPGSVCVGGRLLDQRVYTLEI